MLLYIYKALSVILAPLLWCIIQYRIFKKKEDPKRYKEKFGKASLKKDNKVIWFHAASVGEMKALTPILEKFSELDYQLLITSGTLTSAKIFETIKIKNIIHQFAPLDSPLFIKRFLNYWQPQLGIFVESEIWPNLIIESSKRFKLALINANMSDKSFQIWSKIPNTSKLIFSKFSYIAACSLSSHNKLKLFSNNVASEITNLKYYASPLAYDEALLKHLQNIYFAKKILLCTSTHENEEELILNVYDKIKKEIPDICLIIIPRHPNRGEEVYKLACKISKDVTLKTLKPNITQSPDIYIIDTLGELGVFYRLAKLVFVGASLVKLGGHNIIEPAHLNCCILTGNHYPNFSDVMQEFKNAKAVIEVQDNQELALRIISLFKNESEIERYADNAYKLVNKERGLIDRIYNNLTYLLER
ncbi:3-deoxy-D-manno-octulosonic acid transferase [Holosporaceae bacterium 'Namur']|nr:3-deoxy-D-manno-octulosonic acid transferase [Holosporaceae bacterium 'Namur']